MEEIILRNRYPENKILLRKTGVDWTLESNALYHRLILNDDGSIHALDPEGGPFMSVGSIIQNYKINWIKEVNNEFIFNLENVLN